MYSYGPPHMAVQKQDDQHEHTFSSYVRVRDVVLKTYLGRWTIGRSGERGSGISVLPARYDDDDDVIIGNRIVLSRSNSGRGCFSRISKNPSFFPPRLTKFICFVRPPVKENKSSEYKPALLHFRIGHSVGVGSIYIHYTVYNIIYRGMHFFFILIS